jgi:hypothetical protein
LLVSEVSFGPWRHCHCQGQPQAGDSNVIELKGDRLNIPDWDKSKQAGEFDPTYLHLESNKAAA